MSHPRADRATAAATAWAVLFAVAHAYWALGGRVGVPGDTDPIAERPLFLVYDVVAGVLCLMGAALLIALRGARRRSAAPRRGVITALRLGGAMLALRAAVGLVGDAVLIVGGELRASMLFDVWFLLGAALFALALSPRPRRPSAPTRHESR